VRRQLNLFKNNMSISNQIKIFYINLNDRNDRLKFIKNQLKKNQLIGKKIKGIKPNHLDKKMINKYKNYLTPSGIAGCLVHKKIWELIIKKNIKCALILEDDALISQNLKIFLQNVNKILKTEEIDIININTHEMLTKIGKLKHYFKEIKTGLYNLISIEYGTAGYLITNKCARKLVKDKNFFKLQIDMYLFGKTSNSSKIQNIYQAYPALSIPLASIETNKYKLYSSYFKDSNEFNKVAMSSSDYNNYKNENIFIKSLNIIGNYIKQKLHLKSFKIGRIYFYTKHYSNIMFSNKGYKVIYNKYKI